MSPHVVPKSSLGVHPPPDDEKTAVDSSWEEENSTIDQAEMAEKIRLALAEKRRAGTGSTTGAENTTSTGHTVDEPTVEERQRPLPLLELEPVRGDARLVVEQGPDAGKSFDFKPGQQVLVGRALDNHVVLTDLSVSRKHFELAWDGAGWLLTDRGSGNGTLVNGKIEPSFKLVTGDHVEIGRTTFRFEQPGQAARHAWSEEPSTLAGRRGGAEADRLGPPRGNEYPSPHESMPIPLERKRELPPPRSHPGSNPPYGFAAAPGPAGTFPSSSSYAPAVNGAQGTPHASGRLASGAPAPSPMNTLQGRPPVIGPGAQAGGDALVPPRALSVNQAEMVPGLQTVPLPRLPSGPGMQVRAASMSAPMQQAMGHMGMQGMQGMQSAHPLGPAGMPMGAPMGISAAALVGGAPMGEPGQHARGMSVADSGIAVAAPGGRFSPIARHASAMADRVMPRMSRGTKLTVITLAGGIVLIAALVALAMGVSGESLGSGGTLADPSAAERVSSAAGGGGQTGATETGVASASATGTGAVGAGSPTVEADAGVGTPVDARGSTSSQSSPTAGDPTLATATVPPPVEQAADKAAADKAAADKAAADKAAADKAAADKAAADKAAADKAAADKAAADKAAADKAAADKAAADKAAADKAAADKAAADKAAADKAAADKAAADKAAAAKAAADKAAAAKAAAVKVAAARPATPIGEAEASSLLSRAEDLYRKKSFSAAAATLRNAMKGRAPNDELRMTAKLYEDLAASYATGMAAGAKATEAFSALRTASRADDKLGRVHGDEIQSRLTQVAPKAAVQLVAAKQFEEAAIALREAERLGSTSSTLASVRSAIDGYANELYTQAQSLREDDPAKAKGLLRKVLKLVESGTAMYQKASKAISTL